MTKYFHFLTLCFSLSFLFTSCGRSFEEKSAKQDSVKIPKEYQFRIKYGLVQAYQEISYYTRVNILNVRSFGLGDSLLSEKTYDSNKINKTVADSIFILAYKSNQKLDILRDNGSPYINGSFFEISFGANNRMTTNYYGSDESSENIEELNTIKKLLIKLIKH